MFRHIIVVFVLLGAVSRYSCPAAIVYEGFDYPFGVALHGQNGGAGFAGGWTEPGAPGDLDTIQSGSLTFGALQTSGNSVRSQAPGSRGSDYERDLVDIPGTTGTTLWFSFLMRKDTASGANSEDAFGVILNPTGGAGVFVGDPFVNNFYFLGDTGDGEFASTSVPVVALQTVFLVVRIDFLAGADTIRLFVNPTPGGPAPTVASATKTDRDLEAIDRIRVFAIDANTDPRRSFDEIRLGSTFAEVAPVPEPASIGLLGIGLGVVARRRRIGRRG